jgi:hypothetical protein
MEKNNEIYQFTKYARDMRSGASIGHNLSISADLNEAMGHYFKDVASTLRKNQSLELHKNEMKGVFFEKIRYTLTIWEFGKYKKERNLDKIGKNIHFCKDQ